jgi:hypothetical protein
MHTEIGSHRSFILNCSEVRMHPHEFTLPVADVSVTPLERGTRALAKPPSKKQKIADSGNTQARTKCKKVKGKRGRLKLMTEIPMDILLEIFSHLQPVDVLHLSRVSKRLRDLLTSSNIRYIWTLVCSDLLLIIFFDNGDLSVRFMRI